MEEFTLNEMIEMQKSLQEKYKDKWGQLDNKQGKHQLLWMIGEIGEVIDIIKKNGDTKAYEDIEIRNHLVEELADVLMYFNNFLLCFDINPNEIKDAYVNKYKKNMERW